MAVITASFQQPICEDQNLLLLPILTLSAATLTSLNNPLQAASILLDELRDGNGRTLLHSALL